MCDIISTLLTPALRHLSAAAPCGLLLIASAAADGGALPGAPDEPRARSCTCWRATCEPKLRAFVQLWQSTNGRVWEPLKECEVRDPTLSTLGIATCEGELLMLLAGELGDMTTLRIPLRW